MTDIKVEHAEAYKTEDGGMLEATLSEMKYAVVSVSDNNSELVALFANRVHAGAFATLLQTVKEEV